MNTRNKFRIPTFLLACLLTAAGLRSSRSRFSRRTVSISASAPTVIYVSEQSDAHGGTCTARHRLATLTLTACVRATGLPSRFPSKKQATITSAFPSAGWTAPGATPCPAVMRPSIRTIPFPDAAGATLWTAPRQPSGWRQASRSYV